MNNFNPTDIETAIATIVKGAFATTAVYNNRPKAAPQVNEFIIVSLASDVVDDAVYGTCYVEVSLFARDTANIKNSVKLGAMYTKLIAAMPASSGKYLIDTNPKIIADAPDDYGFHARILNFKITIKLQ